MWMWLSMYARTLVSVKLRRHVCDYESFLHSCAQCVSQSLDCAATTKTAACLSRLIFFDAACSLELLLHSDQLLD
jgi:hypothetical protein